MIKPAATILLGRDHNGSLEVLLLKRNKALAFAGGLWVFPGGKIEADEIRKSDNELAAAMTNLSTVDQSYALILGVMCILVLVPVIWWSQAVRKKMRLPKGK